MEWYVILILAVCGIIFLGMIVLVGLGCYVRHSSRKEAFKYLEQERIECDPDEVMGIWKEFKQKHQVKDTPGIYFALKSKKGKYKIEYSKNVFSTVLKYLKELEAKKIQLCRFTELDKKLLIVPCDCEDAPGFVDFYKEKFNGEEIRDDGEDDSDELIEDLAIVGGLDALF